MRCPLCPFSTVCKLKRLRLFLPPMLPIPEIAELWIYPIKSCAGISVSTMTIDELGPLWDRRWMLVDENGNFLTQRQFPKMAAIRTSITERALTVQFTDQSSMVLNLGEMEAWEKLQVKVWNDKVIARNCGKEAAECFSSFLKKRVGLVFLSQGEPRVRQKTSEFKMGFADSMPFLVINLDSLDEINKRGQMHIPGSRFRANILLKNLPAFSEDLWQKIQLGEIPFSHPEACGRCMITTIDQSTGVKINDEPLKQLKQLRIPPKGGGAPTFGVRLLHLTMGKLKLKDRLYLLD